MRMQRTAPAPLQFLAAGRQVYAAGQVQALSKLAECLISVNPHLSKPTCLLSLVELGLQFCL